MSDLNLLYELYNVHSPSGIEGPMIEFIKAKLKKLELKFTIDEWGNIYVQKGLAANYPCIVAHMDEVHTKRSKGYEVITIRDEIIVGYDKLIKDYHGIGADDKNGIWCCLKALEDFEVLKVAFFTEEETGGTGSMNSNLKFFRDCRFVLQCDRKGNSDFVTEIYGTSLCSKKFIKDIDLKANGYKEATGMFTDIYNLKTRKLPISVCNMSCGYYNPHTKTELTNIEDLYKCYSFVSHIIENCTSVYQHTYVKKYNYYGGYDYFNSYGGSAGVGSFRGRMNRYFHDRYGDLWDAETEEEDDFGSMVVSTPENQNTKATGTVL
jgi:putative aminopeptidase FrvX